MRSRTSTTPSCSTTSDASTVWPPALSPGARVHVVAPSSPFEAVLAWRGLGFLARRYRLRFEREGLFVRRGYLAGDDARRKAELEAALADPDVRAIVAARGGYGASRFVHEIAWETLRARPKWIVGFSDITALHVEAARVGVASIHGCHVTSLGRSDARAHAGIVDVLEAPAAERRFTGLATLCPGRAEGRLFGGNLTLLHACAAAGRLFVPEGAVVFLEDVTERPYRIDRMLTTLLVGGHFERASAVVLGEFTDCPPGPDRVRVEDVLRERLALLGIPVVSGLPCGHGRVNEPLVLGA
ncbi:MAG TPA: LD-carboxypeptidase, partial [Polyangiaceae bacterium]|nr:LD-carboxypeptidase [Polyangiaceae bacterium]